MPLGRRWFFLRVRGGRSSCHKTKSVPKYLFRLTRAGLAEAARGGSGGYRFSGNAKRVTFYQVAEIDGIAVSTLKSIALTTLLKIVERHALLEAEA